MSFLYARSRVSAFVLRLFFMTMAALVPAAVSAVTCTTTGSGTNWNAAANWTNCTGGNGPATNTPGSNDTAVVANGHTISNNVAVTVGAVTVSSGGTLNVAGSNFIVNGATSISGTLNHTNTGGIPTFIGMVTVNPGGIWNNNVNEGVTFRGGITNNGTWVGGIATQTFNTNSQAIAGSSPITFGGAATISGAITVTNNNTNLVRINGRLNGSTGSSAWTQGPNSTLEYAHPHNTQVVMTTGVLNAGAAGNTVVYLRSGNQAIKDTTYHHLTLSGSGTKSLPGITINGDFTLEGTATANTAGGLTVNGNVTLSSGTFDANNYTHNIAGDFSRIGATFTQAGSTLVFDGASPQAISGSTTFNHVTIANTAAAISIVNNNSVGGTLVVASGATLQPTAAVVVGGSGNLTGNGTVRVTRVSGASNFSDQYTIANKTLTDLTVEYAGAAAQTVSPIAYGGLSINNSAGATLAAGTTTVGATLTLLNGALAVGTRTLALNGPAIEGTLTNLVTTSSSLLRFGGNASGVFLPSSVTQLSSLTLDNTNGLTLNSSPIVTSLILTSGAISTGANLLTVSGNCNTNVTRTSGYVQGALRLSFPAAAGSCTFHVGTGSAYAPVTVYKPATASGGALTGQTTGSEHPQIVASAIDPTKNVNRHWTLTDDTIGAGAYGVTLGFTAGDIDIDATAASFVIGRYNGTAWSPPAVSSAQSLSTASTSDGVSGPLDNANFAVGEATFICSRPGDVPASMSCVCDNFGRSSLNPSPIFGGDWSLSSSSGSFGVPKIVNPGSLRLTNNSNDVATAATLPGTFPAAGNMITIDFRHFAYNGNGADGVALTLSDASITPVPGAYGGSLGYAQKDNASCASPPCNGFTGGWVGIGVDEYGNFSNPTEGRSRNPTGTFPNPAFPNEGFRQDSISVRGSGSGLTGYPYIGGTAGLAPGIDSAASTSPAPGHAYRISVDARCYERNTSNGEITCNNPALDKRTQVRVYRDTAGVGDFSAATPLVDFNAYSVNASQAEVPEDWKLSFTGSTGGAVNIHEIQGLKICAQLITPPAGYSIQVDNLTPSTCATPGGNPSSPIVTVAARDTNGNVITTYDKTINLVATLSGGGGSSATWRKVGAISDLPGNQYTFVPADQGVAQFYLTNSNSQSVMVSVNENGGALSSSFADPVVFSGAAFNIENIDALGLAPGGGVVAGRNHLFRITRSNGCFTDTGYSGIKNLDGWYTPVSGQHPSGAFAPQVSATNGSGACLPPPGTDSHTLSIAPPTVDSGSNFIPPLDFVNGVAEFCLATSDVGKYSISLRDDSASPVVGSSTTLTARPFAVVVGDVKQGAVLNNATGVATDQLFAIAGTNFAATVGGYLWNSAADLNNDGLPDIGATLQGVTAAGNTLRYGDTVALSASAYAGGAAIAVPTLSGGSVNVVSGVGAGTSAGLSYPEVGSFTLAAQPHTNYLNSGIDLTPRVAIYTSAAPTSARNSWVGRFRPDHFVVLSGDVTDRIGASCAPESAFTYMGEPLRVRFQLEARNAGNAITRNYAGAWARLTNPGWLQLGGAGQSLGLWMNATNFPNGGADTCTVTFANGTQTTFSCTGGPALGPVVRAAGARVGLANAPAAVAWADGVSAFFDGQVALQRADALDGPYGAVNIGIAPQDSDGVTLNAFNLDADGNGVVERALIASTALRFGQLKLLNGVGSDRLSLPIPMRAEFWNGTSFEVNALDSCTAVANANVGVIAWAGGVNGVNFNGANVAAGSVTLAQGTGVLRLAPPTGVLAASGSAILCVDLDAEPTNPLAPACGATPIGAPWLQGRWSPDVNFDDDPRARATFGVHRGGPIIYMREMY